MIIWLIGLSGSGKTSTVSEIYKKLKTKTSDCRWRRSSTDFDKD